MTPGHFLIRRPLLTDPEIEISADSRPSGHRWKLLNQCAQVFWRCWRDEYLQTLQTHNRWTTNSPNTSVKDMVIIKDPQLPPLKWHMARVLELIPGGNCVVRLHTESGTILHPVVKVVKLPTNQ